MATTAALDGVGPRHQTAGAAAVTTRLWWDVTLYGGSAIFAGGFAVVTTLANHRLWAQIAMVGYAVASVVAAVQLLAARQGTGQRITGSAARAALAVGAWLATAAVPMLLMVAARAAGDADRAQEEVLVVEEAGRRLLQTGSPYLDRATIADLPAVEQLIAYVPYQPGMALFGLPRALDASTGWWSDARIWFALVAFGLIAGALALAGGMNAAARVRALQFTLAAPPVALAMSVGGDDAPVLALCLLGVVLAARHRDGTTGAVMGLACALKLIALPVAVALAAHVATRGRVPLRHYAAAAVTVPAVALLPALLRDATAVAENTVLFPLGVGLVTSPAESPLPGYLIATYLPGGRMLAIGLLLAAGAMIAYRLWRRPPATAAAAAAISGWGLLAAMLLMTATRYGYLLYPLALLVWAYALRPVSGPAARPWPQTSSVDPNPGRWS